MITHLILLWCIGTADPEMSRYLTCTQEQAFKIVDAGEDPENDHCSAALNRWLDHGGTAAAGDAEILLMACEVPK